MTYRDSHSGAPRDLSTAILDQLARAGDGKTLSPPELAHLIDNTNWQSLIAQIRPVAVRLALNGQIVIYRKGKPVDPSDFRGVYRLGLPRHD